MSLLHPEQSPAPDQGAADATPNPTPAGEAPVDRPAPAPGSPPARQLVRGTRTGRVWVGVCAAALITVALIIFMVQNTRTVQVTFLGLTGTTSLALMLLIAAVGGILLTLVLGSARILQLRRAVRGRHR
jgi:uncharacterized integral membrane protein